MPTKPLYTETSIPRQSGPRSNAHDELPRDLQYLALCFKHEMDSDTVTAMDHAISSALEGQELDRVGLIKSLVAIWEAKSDMYLKFLEYSVGKELAKSIREKKLELINHKRSTFGEKNQMSQSDQTCDEDANGENECSAMLEDYVVVPTNLKDGALYKEVETQVVGDQGALDDDVSDYIELQHEEVESVGKSSDLDDFVVIGPEKNVRE